jgi:gluconate 2-dehydrogenase gamma chain
MTFISRRDLLKRAAIAGAAPWIDVAQPASRDAADAPIAAVDVEGRAAREPLEQLTAAEADVLEAIVARLIPSDASGPGAAEAHAARYIDRALGGALSASRQAYASGLAALDRYAQSSRGRTFTTLAPDEQDAVLTEVEKGTATGFAGSPTAFFAMVLSHAHQGTFGDPYYGGNAQFVGWDLLAYPGVRTMVTAAEQQRLERRDLPANHRSAYDYASFTKATPK